MKNRGNNRVGIVLCGGESSRMGSDKSKLIYKEKEQRYHVYEMLESCCPQVCLSVRSEQENNILSAYSFLIDNEKFRGAGPMTALLTAFEFFPGKDLLVAGCDYPYLEQQALQALIDDQDSLPHAYKNDEGFTEPLIAFYPANLAGPLLKYYNEGKQSLRHFLEQANTRFYKPEKDLWLKSIDSQKERDAYLKNTHDHEK